MFFISCTSTPWDASWGENLHSTCDRIANPSSSKLSYSLFHVRPTCVMATIFDFLAAFLCWMPFCAPQPACGLCGSCGIGGRCANNISRNSGPEPFCAPQPPCGLWSLHRFVSLSSLPLSLRFKHSHDRTGEEWFLIKVRKPKGWFVTWISAQVRVRVHAWKDRIGAPRNGTHN